MISSAATRRTAAITRSTVSLAVSAVISIGSEISFFST